MRLLKYSILTCLICQTANLYAGNLTPPSGPPTSTMKSLNEIEPRIALDPAGQSQFSITEPGHYFFTEAIIDLDTLTIASDSVTLDLSGLQHDLQHIIVTNVRNFSLHNGDLYEAKVDLYSAQNVSIRSIQFLSSALHANASTAINIHDCDFSSSHSNPFDEALKIQDSDLQMDRFSITAYQQAIKVTGQLEHHALVFNNGSFLHNSTAIEASNYGHIQLKNTIVDGGEQGPNGSIAFDIEDGALQVQNSQLRNWRTIFKLSEGHEQLEVKNSTLEQFRYVIALNDSAAMSQLRFIQCHFKGIGAYFGNSTLVMNTTTASAQINLTSCHIHGLGELTDNLPGRSCAFHLEDSTLSQIDTLEFGANSLINNSTLHIQSGINAFVIGENSTLTNTEIRSIKRSGSNNYAGPIIVNEGVMLDGCRIYDIKSALSLEADGAIIRNSQITYRGDDAGTAIQIADAGAENRAVLIEHTTISGYEYALKGGGDVMARALTIRNCQEAFDVHQLQLSESTIAADDLGDAQMATLSDSSFRSKNSGLDADYVDIRNCSFTGQANAPLGSGNAIMVSAGGNISQSNFHSFRAGINAQGAINLRDCTFYACNTSVIAYVDSVLHNNTFVSGTTAIDASRSQGSVITNNRVSDTQNGIYSGSNALVRQNDLAVNGTAIDGYGVIVQNTSTQDDYNIQGTVGIVLRGNEITASEGSGGESVPAQPWANLSE